MEFTLAERKDDSIIFLLRHRYGGLEKPKPVDFNSKLAEPMRRALSGRSGTLVGVDYRGEPVLAAHEPVSELNLSIVSKIDLSEIRAPFVKAAAIAGIFSVLVVLGGVALFLKISNPMIKLLEEHNIELVVANKKFRQEIVERTRVEEALRKSEMKYRNIYFNIQDVYYETSPDGIILEISPSIENISKYKHEELIGKSLYDIYADPEETSRVIKEILAKGRVNDYEINLRDKDNSQFYLYFPVTRDSIVEEKSLIPVEDYMGTGQTILIVDDVRDQRELASSMLTKLGYSAKAVSSGEDAIDYLKNNSTLLVLLDMIMDPGIDGLDTYRQIIRLHPKQKAIIASGFSETKRVKEAQKLGAGQYVKKPYTLEKIGIAVKSELASGEDGQIKG